MFGGKKTARIFPYGGSLLSPERFRLLSDCPGDSRRIESRKTKWRRGSYLKESSMKALTWHSKQHMKVDEVKEPVIEEPGDIILKITSSAICGSDLHLYDGYVPTMKKGDIMGHEFMGVVVETGSSVKRFKKGDRVVVPFTMACGNCFYCNEQSFSLCDNSNRDAKLAEKIYGLSGSGLFGFSHLFGGYPGGQAEFVRVPYADVIP